MTAGTGHRLVPHTADMGIEAWSDSLSGLFSETALGLKEMMFGLTPIACQREQTVVVAAEDDAELLVAWLNEILYQLEACDLAPADFRIDQLGEHRLTAVIRGETGVAARLPREREVKAVTYHQLVLEQQPGGWFARVYVDL